MKNITGLSLTVIGVALIAFAAVGLFNALLDSRVVLLIALGAAGLVCAPIGLHRIFATPQRLI